MRTLRTGLLCGVAAACLLALISPATAAEQTVNMQGFQFQPSTRTVAVGDRVTWRNMDGATHTATANNGSFDTGDIAATVGTGSHTFNTPGTFEYYCKYHGSPGSGMHGTIVVQGGPGPTPPPGPSPTPAPAPAQAATPTAAPRAATTTTARATTTTTTTLAPTTTVLPPPLIADPGASTSTTTGGVALPAQTTSTSDDDLNPGLVALAIVLALGAAGGTFFVRRRVAQPSG